MIDHKTIHTFSSGRQKAGRRKRRRNPSCHQIHASLLRTDTAYRPSQFLAERVLLSMSNAGRHIKENQITSVAPCTINRQRRQSGSQAVMVQGGGSGCSSTQYRNRGARSLKCSLYGNDRKKFARSRVAWRDTHTCYQQSPCNCFFRH